MPDNNSFCLNSIPSPTGFGIFFSLSMDRVHQLIDQLDLQAHPEGGFFKETYRSTETHPLTKDFPGGRNFSTGIYFLLTADSFSAFHRIRSDEMWHFYEGDAFEVHVIHPNGQLETIALGPGNYQAVVPAGAWFASGVKPGGNYALVGCTVAPGFDFQDFELAEAASLIAQFPQHRECILKFTR